MKFEDKRFSCNNIVALSFSKVLSSKSDTFSELVEEACTLVTDEDFSETLTLSMQYLEAMKVAQELNVECVPCDVYQGDKWGVVPQAI